MNPSNLAASSIADVTMDDRAPGRPDCRTSQSRRLLIVDDSPTDRSAFKWFGESIGCLVREANGLQEMNAVMQNWTPDILVLDIIMPNSDGLDVMRELKNARCQIPLLLVTGRHTYLKPACKLAAAYGLNVIDVMHKPVKAHDFKATLRRVFGPGI